MAWNTPGSGSGNDDGSKDGRNPWQPRSPRGGIDQWLDRLRGLFGGDGGGSRQRWRWAAIALGLLLVFSSFKLLDAQERGVVLRFGQFNRIMQEGPNFKWPWPIESVIKVKTTEIKTFSDSMPVLTRDTNMVTVDLNVQYRISDPKLFLFGTRDAEEVLRQAAMSTVRELVGRSDLDTVLNSRGELLDEVSKKLQASLEAYRTGLEISGVTLQNARPPDQVKDAFDEAQRATADKQTAINQAQAYAAKMVPEARGDAARLRTVAQGYKTAIIARAQGDAARFSQLQVQYKAAPEVTRKRLWLETLQEVVGKNRKVIGGDGRQLIYVPMSTPTSVAQQPVAPVTPDLVMPAIQSVPERTERPTRPTGREESGR
ncbi:FtsH protease activity modulator HflK [Pseudoxanthomonas helianthi]|uniref:Protein HflK n=1 Tax=Pseudoxanthomonas helianthi TaxID=1453541 RepID=A0A940XAZ7_9GAMM|nr:FtsH protease activity modulator HflK [Pseudoxanthomonas helianthi]MBP3985960.1 FtsH protease activity modulator HflK [Pseudoxanthomonas helianthi]